MDARIPRSPPRRRITRLQLALIVFGAVVLGVFGVFFVQCNRALSPSHPHLASLLNGLSVPSARPVDGPQTVADPKADVPQATDCVFNGVGVYEGMTRDYAPSQATTTQAMRDLRSALQAKGFNFGGPGWFGIGYEHAAIGEVDSTEACIYTKTLPGQGPIIEVRLTNVRDSSP